MAVIVRLSAILLVISTLAVASANRKLLFSSLPRTLDLVASPLHGQVLEAGVDRITITWGLSESSRVDDSSYKTIKVKLCYSPISQEDRPWRKTEDDLTKDKTCQHLLMSKPYSPQNNTFTQVIDKDVPSGTYFLRAYVLDHQGHEVGYGQTTDTHKTTNLFEVRAITGCHVSLDIASAAFSVFSLVSLAWFFYLEKNKAKKASQRS